MSDADKIKSALGRARVHLAKERRGHGHGREMQLKQLKAGTTIELLPGHANDAGPDPMCVDTNGLKSAKA